MFDWVWLDFSHRGWHMLSLSALLGSMVGFFPVIAGLAAFIWYAIQICESETVRRLLARRRAARIARLRKKLEALDKSDAA